MASQATAAQGSAGTGSENRSGFTLQAPASRTGSEQWDTPVFSKYADLAGATLVLIGFVWRLWLAQATFFNTDEAWHYSLANQSSLAAAYKASLTLLHPPLLVFVLYFWRHLGTSNLWLRLPGVLAGSALCWAVYKWLSRVFGRSAGWAGLILVTLLPPMIALSAELRQYTLMMVFAVGSAYLLEGALAKNSIGQMAGSGVCLYLAMLSHYSAFLFAAALAIYSIGRMIRERPPAAVVAVWSAGQAAGVGLASVLYVTQISKLGSLYAGAHPLHNYADWYLSDWYFHPGRDRLLPFLFRGTLGVFRFTFGQTAVAQIAACLFLVAVVLLARERPGPGRFRSRSTAILLVAPLVLSWAAVWVGLYPFGRTRQCVFLALFAIAGVSVALVRMSRERAGIASLLALGMVIVCHARGTLQGRDMLPLAEQQHEHMDQAVQFLRTEVSPEDLIFTDKATSYQLAHYLCDQKPVEFESRTEDYESFQCKGLRVRSTGPNAGALTADTVWLEYSKHDYGTDLRRVWVVEGGWASGLGEALRSRYSAFSQIQVHSFGRYLEAFQLPHPSTAGSPER